MFRSLGIVLFAASFSFAADDKKPAEWIDLVGKDLSANWTTKGHWAIKDGEITLTPRPGEKGWSRFDHYLWSNKSYSNFEIEFEYKVEKAGNSGFYFRVGDKTSPVKNGLEVQIFDSADRPKGDKLNDHVSGGLIPGIPPTKNAAKPAGEWNAMKVLNLGDKLTVTLNGVVVNDLDMTKQKINDRPKTGHIGFQDEALPLGLRNIKIREVK